MKDSPQSWKRRAFLILLALVGALGCGTYNDLSPEAYAYAKALYTITNLRLEDKLEEVAQQIESAREQNSISQREAYWLEAIIRDARDGDWKLANRACRKMMEDQVRRGSVS